MGKSETREPIFVCVGTMKHMLDSVAPRVGTELSKEGYLVLGTIDNQIHARNLHEYKALFESFDKNIYEVIGIDAMFSKSSDKVIELNRPLKPGSGVGKNLLEVGEKTIGINIVHNARKHSYWHYWHKMIFASKKDEQLVKDLVKSTVLYIKENYPLKENEVV